MNQTQGRHSAMFDDDTAFRLKELIPFIGAIVTGAIGGCAANVYNARVKQQALLAFAFAYSLAGGFGGLMALAAAAVFAPEWLGGWSELFLLTGGAGLVTSLALAAGNISMRILLRKAGLEVTIDIRRVGAKNAD